MYPAGIAGISVRSLRLHDGLRLRLLESGPADGEAVLLLHGWAASVYSFAETIPVLADAGYRVLALDLPGHGLSDKPRDESHYTTGALADAVSSAVDELGLPRFVIAGHSLGGLLALELVQRGDTRISRLVLMGAAGLGRVPVIAPLRLLSPRVVNRVSPRLLSRTAINLLLKWVFVTPGRPTDRDVDEYWAPSQFEEFAWACRACVHQVRWRPVAKTKLRSIRVPTLVFAGRRDRIVRGSGRRAQLIPGARIVRLPRCGHILMQECSARVNEELLRFLDQRVHAR